MWQRALKRLVDHREHTSISLQRGYRDSALAKFPLHDADSCRAGERVLMVGVDDAYREMFTAARKNTMPRTIVQPRRNDPLPGGIATGLAAAMPHE